MLKGRGNRTLGASRPRIEREAVPEGRIEWTECVEAWGEMEPVGTTSRRGELWCLGGRGVGLLVARRRTRNGRERSEE